MWSGLTRAFDPFGWDVMERDTKRPLGTGHGDSIIDLVHNLQPNAVVFGGTQPEVRWSGSEQGWAPYPIWNVIRKGQGLRDWCPPDTEGWVLAEANIHTRSSWFWIPNSDQTLRSVDYLMKAYTSSIGRGANLLVNMTPDTSGLIPDAEVKRLAEFGAELERQFSNPIACTSTQKGWASPGILELKIPTSSYVDTVVIEEDIASGQHVIEYAIDTWDGSKWFPIAEGESQ